MSAVGPAVAVGGIVPEQVYVVFEPAVAEQMVTDFGEARPVL